MIFPFLDFFDSGFARSSTRTARKLAKTELGDWKISYSLSSCGKDCVAERRNKRRHSRLTDACWRSIAVNDVYIGLRRYLTNSSYRIILKIGLVDHTIRSRNLAALHNTCAED